MVKYVHILVEVSYDYNRFSYNVYANTDKKKVIDFAKQTDIPLLTYKKEPKKIWQKEVKHYIIESFKC